MNTTTTASDCLQHGPMTAHSGVQADGDRFTGTWFQCDDLMCWNAVLPGDGHPATEGQVSRGTIEITHTRADGTLLYGSRKGDGVWEIVQNYRFTWGRSLPGVLFVRRSRDRQADRWSIRGAAEALRAAGWAVTIAIDEDTRRTFAEAEAERVERAEERAERYSEYAGNAAARSQAGYDAAHRISDGIPMGQPILVGHHSQRRAERDVARMHAGMQKGWDEAKKSAYFADRAKASGAYEAFRKEPGRTLRRIEKLEADQRWLERELAKENSADWQAELNRRMAEALEQLEFWRHVVAEAERAGFKVWAKADFAKGDFALWKGTWYQVLRVNPKTVTVPHIHLGVGVRVVRPPLEGRYVGMTHTLPYIELRGRRSAEEMTAAERGVEAPAVG